MGPGLLFCRRCSCQPRGYSISHRADCVHQEYPLWYAQQTHDSLIPHIANVASGGFWDFTADLTFKDTAYTNEFLGAHTDNTYFTDPARLQLFHLLSHTEGSGGENLLVDGFAAAAQLRLEKPEHYAQLANHRHPWHASGNEDTCIQPSAMAPVFSMHPDLNKMYQIRWNNYDRAPKTNWSATEQTLWYRAARHYNEILQSREMWTTLKPGSALSKSFVPFKWPLWLTCLS